MAATPGGYLLPIARIGDVVVDGSHQRIFIADWLDSKVVAVGYDGSVLGTVSNLAGANGLALSPDQSTLYAAAANAGAVVAIDTASVTETARYSTGAGTGPMHLAAAGGRTWLGTAPTPSVTAASARSIRPSIHASTWATQPPEPDPDELANQATKVAPTADLARRHAHRPKVP